MSELIGLLPFVLLGISLGILLVSFLRLLRPKPERVWSYDTTPMASPQPKRVDMFCADCGKSMISMRSQDGFNPKTGEPIFSYERACPNATSPSNVNYSWPACGKRAKTTAVANAHNHPDQDVTSLDCPVCIDVMLENAGISPKNAIELYLKSGVSSTPNRSPEPDASLAKLFGAMSGGGSVVPSSWVPYAGVTPPKPSRAKRGSPSS